MGLPDEVGRLRRRRRQSAGRYPRLDDGSLIELTADGYWSRERNGAAVEVDSVVGCRHAGRNPVCWVKPIRVRGSVPGFRGLSIDVAETSPVVSSE